MKTLSLIFGLLFPAAALATTQTGSVNGAAGNISGTMTAGHFVGDGAGLTGIPMGPVTVAQFNAVAAATTTLQAEMYAVGASTMAIALATTTLANTMNTQFGLIATSTTSLTASKVNRSGDGMTGPLTMLSGSTITISGSGFSVGGSSFTVVGGSAAVAYGLTAVGGTFTGPVTVAGAASFGGSMSVNTVPQLTNAGPGQMLFNSSLNRGWQFRDNSINDLTMDNTGAAFAYGVSAGSVTTTSSVTASAFFGDGSHLSGISAGSFNGGFVPNVTTFGSSVTVADSVNGILSKSSVTAGAFFGDGSHLTGIPGGGTTYMGSLGYIKDNFLATGNVNGTNAVFTLSAIPSANSEEVILNSALLSPTSDYTLVGNTLTLTTAPAVSNGLTGTTAFFVKYSTGASGLNAFILNSTQTVSGRTTFQNGVMLSTGYFTVGGSTLVVQGGQVSVGVAGNRSIIMRSNSATPTYNVLSLNGASAIGSQLSGGMSGLVGGPTSDDGLCIVSPSSTTFNNNGSVAMIIQGGNGNVGIGTASPGNLFVVANSSFVVDGPTGHTDFGGGTPVLSSCGTSPSFFQRKNDSAGCFQTGSVTGTACVLTFGAAWAGSTPICVVSPLQNTGSVAFAPSAWASATNIAFNNLISSQYYCYICIGH